MNEFLVFFMAAVLIKRVTEYVKKLFGEAVPAKLGKVDTAMVLSLVIGLMVSVGLGIDLFGLIGFEFKVPLIGQLLTGMILSGGSNYLFDLVANLRNPIPGEIEE